MLALSIIIVNYKTPHLLLRCIDSVKNTIGNITHEVIVIDNYSQDNSEDLILRKFNDIVWINNSSNEGFGRANNIGIKKAKGEYILLLNSDIILLPKTIEHCLNAIRVDDRIGILGCNLLNEDGSIQKAHFSIASFSYLLNQNLIIDKFFRLKEPKHNAIMGSFMLFPKKILNEVGLFDPDFFMYCEELDLCHRIIKAGYEIKQEKEVSVIHKHGGSSSNQEWGIRQRYLSNALLFYKIKGLWGYLFYLFISLLNTATNFIAMWFLDHNFRKAFLSSQKAFYKNSFYYFSIPIFYKQNIGNGKRLLKRN